MSQRHQYHAQVYLSACHRQISAMLKCTKVHVTDESVPHSGVPKSMSQSNQCHAQVYLNACHRQISAMLKSTSVHVKDESQPCSGVL
ncbi:hypothetical protein DPMN_106671 [Dreissena polymorpha]|uniref:Uncharacterized protein n=1 Tax=Dreissena polymorpha TaxID=45954 RepID=A0A9D4K5K3_DREPO|nr:hypothetical protein DPMN_106671 [Dreissena polymorpha]